MCFKVSTNQTVEYPLSLRTHCPSLHADQSQHAVIQIDGRSPHNLKRGDISMYLSSRLAFRQCYIVYQVRLSGTNL